MTGFYRSIAAQDNLGFNCSFSLNKTTGIFSFGFNSGKMFEFKSGIIYENNSAIWGYTPNQTINISGNLKSGNLNYYINGAPISFNSQYSNYISGFNLNWDELKVSPTYSVDIFGEIPEYEIIIPPFVLTGQNISGYIKNNRSHSNLSFKFFSGAILNNNTSFLSLYNNDILGAGGSGQFVISGINTIGVFPLLLQFNSNFGVTSNTIFVNVTGGNVNV